MDTGKLFAGAKVKGTYYGIAFEGIATEVRYNGRDYRLTNVSIKFNEEIDMALPFYKNGYSEKCDGLNLDVFSDGKSSNGSGQIEFAE